jgi:hypothetical protein
MKPVFTLLLLLSFSQIFGQKNIPSTDFFSITGAVKKEQLIALKDIKALKEQKIKDVPIVNHKGEKHGKAQKLRGVKLLDILQKIEIDEASPKKLSEYYLVFEASDGYSVVYSWNELFNSPTGQNTFIVTQKDGVALDDMLDRIVVITPSDFSTGRRFVKGLAKIRVEHMR